MKIGIIAALPGELKPLVRGWSACVASNGSRIWTKNVSDCLWVAACAGMGENAVRRAFVAAEADGPLDMVLSVGWAGALVPELKPGEVRAFSQIIDAQTGERFSLGNTQPSALITSPRVVSTTEKVRLRETYPGAVMVDMEAATVARMAEMRGIPLACIKAVSDSATARLPDLNHFISPAGQIRMVPFVAHLALRPRYWSSTAQLGKDSARAAQAMSSLIIEFMEEKNVDRLNRTGSP